LCIHAFTIKYIQYIFIVRVGKRMVQYTYCYLLHFALESFPSNILLLTSVYYFDVTALYSLIQWFSGEILNSLCMGTKKPKAHLCQYFIIGAIQLN